MCVQCIFVNDFSHFVCIVKFCCFGITQFSSLFSSLQLIANFSNGEQAVSEVSVCRHRYTCTLCTDQHSNLMSDWLYIIIIVCMYEYMQGIGYWVVMMAR